MIFSSIEFLLFFLPIFLLLYALAPGKMKNVTLLSGSLIFYALGEPKYLGILLLSVGVNYLFGLGLERVGKHRSNDKKYRLKLNRKRKTVLGTAVLFNIGLLAMFKCGVGGLRLPMGISFYTFQSMSYLLDVYRGEQKRETSLPTLATYITMFPQLLSGPIVSYGEVRERLHRREFDARGIQEGLKVFTMGLASKVLLADRVGLLWQDVQVKGFESISTPLAWLGAVAFSMKIYFDFYGYSLMASGLGRMLGFELPENFRDPYMACSVREFYRRWHITLSRWFCKYVYIPLGGNRRGEFRTVCNLLAVWFLTSIWHGVTPNFLIWGMMLWLAIVIERQLGGLGAGRLTQRGLGKLCSRLYVWTVIPITWVCFAVTDIDQLQIYLGRMFDVFPGVNVSRMDWHRALEDYGRLLALGALGCTPVFRKVFGWLKDTIVGFILLAALFWLCVWRLQVEGQNPFMYLQF